MLFFLPGIAVQSDASGDYVYRLSATVPSTPTGGTTVEDHTPAGWSRSAPSPTSTLSVYQSYRQRTYRDGVFYSATAWGSPTVLHGPVATVVNIREYAWGLNLVNDPNGQNVDAPSCPTFPTTTLPTNVYPPFNEDASGWFNYDDGDSIFEEGAYDYPGWALTRHADGVGGYVLSVLGGIPVCFAYRSLTLTGGAITSRGPWGVAQDIRTGTYTFREYIYMRSASVPTAPSGGMSTARHVPSGWSAPHGYGGTNIDPTATAAVYQAYRTVTVSGGSMSFQSATTWGNITKVIERT